MSTSSQNHPTHLEVADLLAKGLPHVQVGNSVVEDGLHDPARRRETLRRGFAVIPLPVVCVCGGGHSSVEMPEVGGQPGETRSWHLRQESGA